MTRLEKVKKEYGQYYDDIFNNYHNNIDKEYWFCPPKNVRDYYLAIARKECWDILGKYIRPEGLKGINKTFGWNDVSYIPNYDFPCYFKVKNRNYWGYYDAEEKVFYHKCIRFLISEVTAYNPTEQPQEPLIKL